MGRAANVIVELQAMVRSKRPLSPLIKVKDALTRERRKNRRLRAVIDALGERIAANRRDLDLQFTRLAQLQAEVDGLKSNANAVQKSEAAEPPNRNARSAS